MSLFMESHFSVFAEDCVEEGKELPLNVSIDGEEVVRKKVISDELSSVNLEQKESTCPAIWDDVLCWFPIPAGKIARVSCRSMFQAIGSEIPKDDLFKGAFITRVCDSNGSWVNRTNYEECLPFFPTQDETPSLVPRFVSLTLFVGSLLSLAFLLVSFLIFSLFPSLECTRIRVHRNLIAALFIHSFLLVIMIGPVVLGLDGINFKSSDFVCKFVLALKLYASMASINWMFVEGLLLHTKLSGVFTKEPPFVFYYAIGWGVPGIVIVCWSSIMTWTLDSHCWEGYSESPFVWMVIIPTTIALIANSIFLINIIRILIMKIKDSVSVEMRKALKATALLFPLLGMDHLFFCVNPKNDDQLEDAYVVINAIVQASQGTLVAVLYCFINTEVRSTIKSAYLRYVLTRSVNSGGTRRGSESATRSKSIKIETQL